MSPILPVNISPRVLRISSPTFGESNQAVNLYASAGDEFGSQRMRKIAEILDKHASKFADCKKLYDGLKLNGGEVNETEELNDFLKA